MERRNVYFSTPVWQRLKALSAAEETPMADILRRLLSDSLGITEDVRVAVEDAHDAGDPLPKLRRTVIKEQLERSKLANQVMRLRLDLDDLAGAEAPRQEAWEGMKTAFAQLHTAMQQHIDRSERLFKTIAQNQAGLYAGLKELRDAEEPRRVGWQKLVDSTNTLYDQLQEHIAQTQRLLTRQDQGIAALYTGSKQLGLIAIDLLRRMDASERGSSDEETEAARARGAAWLDKVEADILTHTSSAERAEHDEAG